jgi:integrase
MQGSLALALPRPATGRIDTHRWKDGRTVSFYLRVPYKGRRYRILLGTNLQGWSLERAEIELEKVMGQIERGTWVPPDSRPLQDADIVDPDETLHVTLSRFWQRKEPELGDDTRTDYYGRVKHILAYRPSDRTTDIDARWVDDFKGHLVSKGLGARRVNMVLSLLAMALDDAVDYGMLDANPARGRRRRMKEPPKNRQYLEPDMVIDLLDAAGEWEKTVQPSQRYGRRALLATLILAGPRISELLEAPRGGLDIHQGILRLGKKTEAGIDRKLELSAALLDELRPHMAATAGRKAKAPLFASRTGGELNPSNLRNRLLHGGVNRKGAPPTKGAVERANDKRAAEGKMLLPPVTPHLLRRTFATFAVFAGRDLRWIMGQLGHVDPDTTLKIYAQAMKRRRVDYDIVWSLMRFSDEPEAWSNRPTNRPTAEVDHVEGGVR